MAFINDPLQLCTYHPPGLNYTMSHRGACQQESTAVLFTPLRVNVTFTLAPLVITDLCKKWDQMDTAVDSECTYCMYRGCIYLQVYGNGNVTRPRIWLPTIRWGDMCGCFLWVQWFSSERMSQSWWEEWTCLHEIDSQQINILFFCNWHYSHCSPKQNRNTNITQNKSEHSAVAHTQSRCITHIHECVSILNEEYNVQVLWPWTCRFKQQQQTSLNPKNYQKTWCLADRRYRQGFNGNVWTGDKTDTVPFSKYDRFKHV